MTDKNKITKSQNTTVLLLGLVALSGCNQVGKLDLASTGSLFNSNNAPAYQHTISELVSTSDAFVQLPVDAGRVLEVSQTRYGNGVEQLVVYQGDSATRGENAAQVKMAVHVEGKKQTESLRIGSVSVGRISNELRTALPGIAMQISNEINNNAYGPFGYALGLAPGGVRCIYGWQQMKGSKNDRWAVFKRISQKPRLSIRLRVCRSHVTNSQLVGLMQNLRVTADPAAVLRPTAVSWDAGSGGRATGALPSYERSGFSSEQREVYQEIENQPIRKARVRRAKPRRVKRTPRIVTEQRQALPMAASESRFQAPAYSPPLPDKYTPSGSRAVGKGLVPVPPPSSTVRPNVKPVVSAPLVTARTYQPQAPVETPVQIPVTNVSTTPVIVSGAHSAVPLPN